MTREGPQAMRFPKPLARSTRPPRPAGRHGRGERGEPRCHCRGRRGAGRWCPGERPVRALLHGVGVGCLGVVDEANATDLASRARCDARARGRPRWPRRTSSMRTPSSSAIVAAARAFSTLCSPLIGKSSSTVATEVSAPSRRTTSMPSRRRNAATGGVRLLVDAQPAHAQAPRLETFCDKADPCVIDRDHGEVPSIEVGEDPLLGRRIGLEGAVATPDDRA